MIRSFNITKLGFSFFIGMMACLLSSCDNELEVRQAYPFTLETMPVQTKIVKGETAEIRCTLHREGRYDEARYTIRYFQPDGKGTLRMDDGTAIPPTTAIRSTARCSVSTTPPHRPTSRPSTSTSRIISGRS